MFVKDNIDRFKYRKLYSFVSFQKIPNFYDLLQFTLFYKINLVFTSAQAIPFTWLRKEFGACEVHAKKTNKVSEMVKQYGAWMLCGCCVQNESMNFVGLF